MRGAGLDAQAELGGVERDRDVGAHGGVADLAGGRVDAARHVERQHRPAARFDRLDGGGDRVARRAREARAEQRVDHELGAVQRVLDGATELEAGLPRALLGPGGVAGVGSRRDDGDARLDAALAQQPGDDQPVAAVVAAAAEHGDPPGVREALAQHELGGRRGARHQAAARDAVRLDGARSVARIDAASCSDDRERPCAEA